MKAAPARCDDTGAAALAQRTRSLSRGKVHRFGDLVLQNHNVAGTQLARRHMSGIDGHIGISPSDAMSIAELAGG